MGMIEWLLEKPCRDYFDDIRESRSSSKDSYATATTNSNRSDVTIMNLRVGDYVTFRSVDYYVRQRFMYRAGSFEWMAYQFSDSSREKSLWLDVEEDDELSIEMSEPIKLPPEITVEHLKAKQPVSINGVMYYYDEHGYAQVKIEKENKRWDEDTVEYWDYYSQDESQYISFEKWGADELEGSVGYPIKDYELEIYPGS
jgi:hypothetical protein